MKGVSYDNSIGTHNIVRRFMNFYFPAKLIKLYGFHALPFIFSTLLLYVTYDILYKILRDSVRIFRLKPRIPIMLFTPSAHPILLGFLDFSVLAILHEIYVEEVYRAFLDYEPKAGWVVVDAGAHVGLYTLYAVDRRSKLIIALEPDSRNYRRLITTLRVNKVRNVVALPYALAGKDGYLNFLQSIDTGKSHIVVRAREDKTIKIRGVNLLTLIRVLELSHIDILKLDVEGAEYSIASSSDEVLREGRVRRIVGEIHGKQIEIDEFMEHLQGLGFKIEYLLRFTQTALIHAKYCGLCVRGN